jgi:hypothetical protein
VSGQSFVSELCIWCGNRGCILEMLKGASGGRLINVFNENISPGGRVFKWQPENCGSMVTFTCMFRGTTCLQKQRELLQLILLC